MFTYYDIHKYINKYLDTHGEQSIFNGIGDLLTVAITNTSALGIIHYSIHQK